MSQPSDDQLDQLLKGAFPLVEPSADFTLNLWRKLIQVRVGLGFRFPTPVYAMAACIGILAGIWTGMSINPLGIDPIHRLDLFGNAPMDTMAGSYLTLVEQENGIR